MIPLLVLLGMALGAVLGAFNGLIIAVGNVPPIIATLGTVSVYRGLVFYFSQGNYINAFEMPVGFKQLAKGTPFGVPNLILIAIFVAILVYYFLNYTRAGRDIYAVGGNQEAARLSGVNVARVKLLVYAISGALSGLAGVLLIFRLHGGISTNGDMYEMDAIAACVIGGTSLSGGVGTVGGTLIGILIMGCVRTGLTLLNVSANWQRVIIGLIILAAVGMDLIRRRMRSEA